MFSGRGYGGVGYLLTGLSAFIFATLLLLIALIVPVGEEKVFQKDEKKAKTKFEEMSRSMKKGFTN